MDERYITMDFEKLEKFEKLAKDNTCCKENPDNHCDEEDYLEYLEASKKPGYVCYCDNCFYGKDELSRVILELIEELRNVKK